MEGQRRMIIFWLYLQAIIYPVFSAKWEAKVTKEINALVTSCVVVPCSFSYPGNKLPDSKMRGIWHHQGVRNDKIYHEDRVSIVENFRGRTKLLGHLGDGNCTLEIVELKDHDSGPFCFRAELPGQQQFSFMKNCVRLTMLSNPPKPKLNHKKAVIQGHPCAVTCSITHNCPSHMPNLTWSRGSKDDIIGEHKDSGNGNWETMSILTFIPEEKDDHSEITCRATFNGGHSSFETLQLFVKRKENYLHIIIPISVGVGTAVMFGVLCILMMKRYKKRISDLQNGSGNGLWNRMSRMSRRIRSGGSKSFNPEQARAIWSRFSRRHQRDMVNLDASNKQNNMSSTTHGNMKISKPRYPSPKSQPKSFLEKTQPKYNKGDYDEDGEADYTNTADLDIYGNFSTSAAAQTVFRSFD